MEGKAIYIAGLMNGLTQDQIKTKFETKQAELEAKGFKVINPVNVVAKINADREAEGMERLTEEKHRPQILGLLLHHLSWCDELHLMPCWQKPKGAQLERSFARSVGIDIVYH